MTNKNIERFRHIGNIEGYSFLILLFIAMPLKYFFDYPVATKIAGMVHGILFILFCMQLLKASEDANWSMKENAIYFVASLIPFGTFYTNNLLKNYNSKV